MTIKLPWLQSYHSTTPLLTDRLAAACLYAHVMKASTVFIGENFRADVAAQYCLTSMTKSERESMYEILEKCGRALATVRKKSEQYSSKCASKEFSALVEEFVKLNREERVHLKPMRSCMPSSIEIRIAA